jgi:hypothetical protein
MNSRKKIQHPRLISLLLLAATSIILATAQNIATTAAQDCETLRDNTETNANPLTTVSDKCITANITSGEISLSFQPHSFFFPRMLTSGVSQNTFSNDNPATPGIVDVATGPEDILTVTDLTENNTDFGMDLTASTESLTSPSGNSIPISNLYVVTTAPTADSLNTLDPGLNGTVDATNGIVYSTGSVGQNITSPTATTEDLNIPETYTTSMDANSDGIPDNVVLMDAYTPADHFLQASQALSFMLHIPENQPAGTYAIQFTITIIPD